jgi:hypothetical protein
MGRSAFDNLRARAAIFSGSPDGPAWRADGVFWLKRRRVRGHLSPEAAPEAGDLEMRRPGLPGHSSPDSLADEIGEAGGAPYARAHFCDAREKSALVGLLVEIPVLRFGRAASCDRQDRTARHIGVQETGGEVGRANGLRAANADPSARPGVAVRHIGGRFLRVRYNRVETQRRHFNDGARHDDRHVKKMLHAVSGERLREDLVARPFCRWAFLGRRASVIARL